MYCILLYGILLYLLSSLHNRYRRSERHVSTRKAWQRRRRWIGERLVDVQSGRWCFWRGRGGLKRRQMKHSCSWRWTGSGSKCRRKEQDSSEWGRVGGVSEWGGVGGVSEWGGVGGVSEWGEGWGLWVFWNMERGQCCVVGKILMSWPSEQDCFILPAFFR